MDKNDAHSRIEYEEMLTKLVPLLKTLSSRIPVIWMHQNPIIDTNHFFAIFANPTNRKYYEYNVLSRRLLKYANNMILLDRKLNNIFV